jgi:hypothetical protein
MKRNIWFTTLLFAAGSLIAADSSPKDDVISAAKQLGAKDNYSWKTSIENNGGGQNRGGPTEGKTEKGGLTSLLLTRGDNTTQVVLKGEKGAIKTEDGWQSVADAAKGDGNGGQNRNRFLVGMLRRFKTPAEEAENIASKTTDLKNTEGVYSGALTEEGAKALLSFGGRRSGGDGPTISDAKGSVKFWVKDGAITKYQYSVKGSVSFNGNDRDVDRTTTVEIKDIGSTKVDAPEEAKSKLS